MDTQFPDFRRSLAVGYCHTKVPYDTPTWRGEAGQQHFSQRKVPIEVIISLLHQKYFIIIDLLSAMHRS
jgi:hypothetical protein